MPRVRFFKIITLVLVKLLLMFLNNILQVNHLKMVDEPMEEGEAGSCQVSTHVNLLTYILELKGRIMGKEKIFCQLKKFIIY